MIVAKWNTLANARSLFDGWRETLIDSCFQEVMGRVYVPEEDDPCCAVAMLGDFGFYAGEPNEALLRFRPADYGAFLIQVPQNEVWAECIERVYGENATKVVRYAFDRAKEFDTAKLETIVSTLPECYELRRLDRAVYNYCRNQFWCRDWVSQFRDYEDYEKRGIGMVILKDGVPVSGASSYSVFQGGVEIEIDTHEDFQNRGLALISGAALILECLKKDLYPSWDAANMRSVRLATKLGYPLRGEYIAYHVFSPRNEE